MSEYFEIAYAAVAHRLCLFTGTGFSKAVTANAIPGWRQLLVEICDRNGVDPAVKSSLFPSSGNGPLHLEEAAKVVQLKVAAAGRSIHAEAASIVSSIDLADDIDPIRKFFGEKSFRVVTTNYDKLSETLAGVDCQSITPGLPIPRSNSRVKVFHVHGSIDFPERMVVTSDDYFDFMSRDSYFSRKLSTVLYENTVVILGYSLGDGNLKSILNDHSGFMRNHSVGSSIFFVSRDPVVQEIADYYSDCYGIRVIDNTEVKDFFEKLDAQFKRAGEVHKQSITDIKKVLYNNHHFKKEFLKMEGSFSQVISALGAVGEGLESASVVKLFDDIITSKKELCGQNGAWDQYTHLASWLAQLGSLMEIKSKSIETTYLTAVKFSMERMSKGQMLGYSWHAYQRWNTRWKSIRASNRTMIANYIRENCSDPDALEIVSRG